MFVGHNRGIVILAEDGFSVVFLFFGLRVLNIGSMLNGNQQ